MITKEIIRRGLMKGCVEIIDTPKPYGDGAVCMIKDSKGTGSWFYFGGLEANNKTAEEYMKKPISEIVDAIYESLDEMEQFPETEDEYYFYDSILKEELIIIYEVSYAREDGSICMYCGSSKSEYKALIKKAEDLGVEYTASCRYLKDEHAPVAQPADKFEVELPEGKLVVERKGAKDEYPGVYVSYENNGEEGIVACVEYDTCGEEIRTETYTPHFDSPNHIICYPDGRDAV